jgi:Tol biopolymer transport system component
MIHILNLAGGKDGLRGKAILGHILQLVLVILIGLAMISGCAPSGGAASEAILASGGGSILNINVETGGARKLANGKCPVLSPDGRQIAFLDKVQADIDLDSVYMMSSSGSHRKLVVGKDFAYTHGLFCPYWFGNDSLQVSPLKGYFYRLDVATGEMRVLAGDLSGLVGASPDGSRILFSDKYKPFVYITDAAGSNKRVILETNEAHVFYTYFSWSPSGDRVAYILSNTQAIRPDDVMVVNVAGGEPLNLTNTPDIEESSPVWSPDGSKIAYIKFQSDHHVLCVINAGGGTPLELVSPPDVRIFGRPSWSPDGTRIAYAGSSSLGTMEVYVANVSDGLSKKITRYSPVMPNTELLISGWMNR